MRALERGNGSVITNLLKAAKPSQFTPSPAEAVPLTRDRNDKVFGSSVHLEVKF